MVQANMDFEKALARHTLYVLPRKVLGREHVLPSLHAEIGHGLQLIQRGTQTIEIDAIVGSVSDNRNFDAQFNPTHKNVQDRWSRIRVAFYRDENLPPIEVVKVGECYYIEDGHHRVSVARNAGQAFIEAQVREARGFEERMAC